FTRCFDCALRHALSPLVDWQQDSKTPVRPRPSALSSRTDACFMCNCFDRLVHFLPDILDNLALTH
ncbi:hypothetical protein QSH82_22720, partial [Escherichia coli]|uniref:hypothetical protein n=1 Tax=Escherichia coli TaxID=562 RepID=UPI00256EC76A